LKVLEKVLKLCLNRKVKVNYGRCSSGRGAVKCQIEGYLLAFDNLCLVIAVPGVRRSVERLVIIKKSEIESIELEDRDLIIDVLELLPGGVSEAGD